MSAAASASGAFSQDDPTGDDHGPGTYQYPTSGDLHPGAFDLTKFQVYDTGSTITFRVQTADLTPTFGATNGARLVDVYVSEPGATTTSTAAPYPSMSYTLATPWTRLIEVQGFGNNLFENASGASAGTVTASANQVSRYITFSVDKTALGGEPVTGWAFAVTLTGQAATTQPTKPAPSPPPRRPMPSACALRSTRMRRAWSTRIRCDLGRTRRAARARPWLGCAPAAGA